MRDSDDVDHVFIDAIDDAVGIVSERLLTVSVRYGRASVREIEHEGQRCPKLRFKTGCSALTGC